jgi:DNA repair exonuclease SbcCD nuclease subunit
MWKFIHCADIHLDSTLRGLSRYEGAPAADLRRSTRGALENLVDLALAERVACLVVAGDLYDGDWHDHGTGLYLNAQFSRLRDSGIAVYLIRGNHDAESQITRHLTLPDNVRMLRTDEPETLRDDDLGLAVHGQGFATRAVTANLAEAYPPRVPHYFNLGLLHTCASGREGHEAYAPCTVEGLRAKGYDYWALGHIHKREELHLDPPIVFPGNLQGRHARETGPKGCTVVTVEGGRATRLEHRPLDVIRWAVCRVDAAGASDLDDLLPRVSDRLEAERVAAEGRMVAARVEIVGACRAHDHLAANLDDLAAEVRNVARDAGRGLVWVEKVKLLTTPSRRLDLADGPLGVLAQVLEELRRDDERLHALASAELADLRKKLPSELRQGDEPLDLDSPALLREALGHVLPLVVSGLGGQEARP